MNRFVRAATPALFVLALVLPACSGGGGGGGGGGITPPPPPPPPPPGNSVTVHLTAGLRFSPATVTIAPGTTVRWINDAALGHTVTPDNAAQPGAWTSQALTTQNQVFDHTFNTPGTYNYHCEPHRLDGMTGVVVVQ